MILANISAARFVEKAKEPALFRIHDKPTTEAVTSFRSVLAELGLELPGVKCAYDCKARPKWPRFSGS